MVTKCAQKMRQREERVNSETVKPGQEPTVSNKVPRDAVGGAQHQWQ